MKTEATEKHMAEVVSWILMSITGVGLLIFFAALCFVLPVKPMEQATFFRWAAYGGLPSSLVAIVAGFFRSGTQRKRDAVAFGFLMFLLWAIMALYSISKS